MTRPYDVLMTALPDETLAWLDVVVAKIAADPSAIRAVFPLVGRRCGRDRIHDQWTADEAVRAVLLAAVPADAVEAELTGLYRHGDRAEQRAALRALDLLDSGETGLVLIREALRSNDTALIAAALGPFGAGALPIEEYRQAVLKCVFNDIPLEQVAGLPERADGELARMMADFACERVAAGRAVPPDIWPIVLAFPADTARQQAAIDADTTSPVMTRREAAIRALADLAGVN